MIFAHALSTPQEREFQKQGSIDSGRMTAAAMLPPLGRKQARCIQYTEERHEKTPRGVVSFLKEPVADNKKSPERMLWRPNNAITRLQQ